MKNKITDVKINIDVINESVLGEKSNWESSVKISGNITKIKSDTWNKFDTENALKAIVETFEVLNSECKVKLITNSPIIYSLLNKKGASSYEYMELSEKVEEIKSKHKISCFIK